MNGSIGSKIRLKRTGDVPLSFNGQLVAEADSGRVHDRTRWFEAKLYRTTTGRLILAIGYRSRWDGDNDRDVCLVIDREAAAEGGAYESLQEAIQGFAPEACPAPYPAGQSYIPKQERLDRDVRVAYERAIAGLLEAVEESGVEIEPVEEMIE